MDSWSYTKRNDNGQKGEIRTKSILADHFWLLERSVDIGGGDLLVELRYSTKKDYFDSRERHKTYAYIQSKFFENNNTSKVAKEYVLDSEGEPRQDFFVFFHTDSNEGEHLNYFLSAKEITVACEIKVRSGKEYYIFKSKELKQFSNRKINTIKELITSGIINTRALKNRELLDYANAYNNLSLITGDEDSAWDLSLSAIQKVCTYNKTHIGIIRKFLKYVAKSDNYFITFLSSKFCGMLDSIAFYKFNFEIDKFTHDGTAQCVVKNNNELHLKRGAEIGTIYNLSITDKEGKKYLYLLNEGAGDCIFDNSVNHSVGTLMNRSVDNWIKSEENRLLEHPLSAYHQEYFFFGEISQSELRTLREIGILNTEELNITIMPESELDLELGNETIQIKQDEKMTIECLPITDFGNELFLNIYNRELINDNFKQCVKLYVGIE
ncbi:hypothetical protein [Carboxylicivirga marina]|uniref:hypothetical protein n=1 Tax=Carboxylicivirga marina TaxID=2800988 RepID=UPI00259AD3CA|nr:hypothetical protein [uncultured Carboxylicivirga sp.]